MKKLLIIALLFWGCEEPSQHGCLDSQACNYDADATIDNNSCIYEVDCAEVCGGSATIDCDGVCDGDAELSDCIVGTYTLTTQMGYYNSDCSGIGENTLPDSLIYSKMNLSSDGSGWYEFSWWRGANLLQLQENIAVAIHTELSWTINGDQVTITYDLNENNMPDDDVSYTYTFTEDYSLKIQYTDEDWCLIKIFTKP